MFLDHLTTQECPKTHDLADENKSKLETVNKLEDHLHDLGDLRVSIETRRGAELQKQNISQ